jgi:hypothetical protein
MIGSPGSLRGIAAALSGRSSEVIRARSNRKSGKRGETRLGHGSIGNTDLEWLHGACVVASALVAVVLLVLMLIPGINVIVGLVAGAMLGGAEGALLGAVLGGVLWAIVSVMRRHKGEQGPW